MARRPEPPRRSSSRASGRGPSTRDAEARSSRDPKGRSRDAKARSKALAKVEPRKRTYTKRRLAAALVTTVLLVGVLFVGVFPTRTYLAQRAATQRSEAELRQVRKERAEVERKRKKLETDAEIERQAREDLGYVKPGEEAYNILPARDHPLGLPEGWPFTGVEQAIAAG